MVSTAKITETGTMKKLVVFDLDGTLAQSKSSLDTEMATLLNKLIAFIKVAVISGGDWTNFKSKCSLTLPETTA